MYFSRLAIVYISFCVECCGTSCMRLQCCLQNSSAVKGTDGCTLLSNGVKKVVPKRYSKLLAGICKDVIFREKVALLVLDAKVVANSS